MHDRLPPKGMCLGSSDFFKFWEASGNISGTVRDRHIVAIEDIQGIVCGLSNSTFSDLEGHFCCLNLCVHPPRWFASMMVHWRSIMR